MIDGRFQPCQPKTQGHWIESFYGEAGLTIHRDMDWQRSVSLGISIVKSNYADLIRLGDDSQTFSLGWFTKYSAHMATPPHTHVYSADLCNSIIGFWSKKIEDIHQWLAPSP